MHQHSNSGDHHDGAWCATKRWTGDPGVSSPHLAAICPWEGFSDLHRDFARPGGVRDDGFTIIWDNGLKKGGVRINTEFRKEIANRPERDGWYKSTVADLARIGVSILVCGSFSDHSLHTQGSIEAFRRMDSALKSLYTHCDGKWCAFYGQEATATRGRFFDHTLKGPRQRLGEGTRGAYGDLRRSTITAPNR